MTETNTLAQPWSPAQKWGFRFALLFFGLFILLNPNGGAPLLNETYDYYILPMHKLMVWMGAHVFHLPKPITMFTAGSGDTTYDWLVLLLITVLALLGSVVWTLVSRKPVSYDRLYYWLIVVLRFYLGIMMITYGSVKVVKLQFPMPSPYRLLEPYGDSSPMTLAWTFVGYSKGYNYFTGLAELLCGILLLFRRTTTLGAVIALTVAVNIMAINYCFDVPVKIVSSTLVLITIFILLKDMRRMLQFFIYNQPAQPSNITPRRFQKKWKNITLLTVKYLMIAYVLYGNVWGAFQATPSEEVKRPVLYGIFNTRAFVQNRDTLKPLTTDTSRWRRMLINGYGGVRITLMNDSTRSYSFKTDTVKKLITLGSYIDTNRKYVFKYTLSKDSVLQMDGKGPNGEVSANLKRYDEKKFLLLRRGFHWVNEVPFAK